MAHKTVLIVDDDSAVRMYLKAVLESEGFHTIEAEDGVQALELIRKLGTDVDLLISDIRMPQMDGVTLGCSVRAEFPEIPIVLTSGYTADCRNPGFEFIPKPFALERFLSVVRRVMVKKAGA